jgi:hypothetical protein
MVWYEKLIVLQSTAYMDSACEIIFYYGKLQ